MKLQGTDLFAIDKYQNHCQALQKKQNKTNVARPWKKQKNKVFGNLGWLEQAGPGCPD